MKSLRNTVQLIGRLGKDPEVKTLTSGRNLATFTIATTDMYYNADGEKVEDTQWHNITAWGKRADIASKYLVKGQEIALEGRLIHRSYENGNGEKRYVTEVSMNELLMIGGKKV
ncbi:single-stranded DNA-binding protein [Fulvivirga sp. M361]|uniref:single-stranded DNA-binding protein n=1 Tax=Fulvivirga sp. M361 TaxID=2594266 RepID=UPI00117B230F|nr:single-stranded DNA-binding protein [Fulvivirga sp. M361]TRX58715.1 single-stranded DNA-binding protein [Fulvivirga sp. M361]